MYETLQPRIDEYRKVIAEYRALYEQDGNITPDEQRQLDALDAKIRRALSAIAQRSTANGNGSAAAMDSSSPKASSAANMRVVPGAGGYEYEQHADGTIFIVRSPINSNARTEVQKDTTAYNAILAEIGPFPSSGAPGPVPPEPPADEPTSRLPPTGGGEAVVPPGDHAAWDLEKAVQHLKTNAEPAPVGLCAQYTREAIEAGGVTLKRTNYAKDYGPSLLEVGFQTVNTASYQAGDVVIMQNCEGHDYGHMQMYSGSQWISDYVQRDFWPYTSSRPAYAVYRFPLSGGDGRR